MIALMFCGDIKYCPYVIRYIDRLNSLNKEYQIVFWNRSNESIDKVGTYRYFDHASNMSLNKASKMLDFIRFRKWLIEYVKQEQPERCVLLSTLTGIMIGDILKRMNIPYIFYIRDYSYEYIRPYMNIEKRVIMNSYQTVISSKGFKDFLPNDYDYVIAHNFNRKDILTDRKFTRNDKIRFVWNGMVRYFDYQKQIINSLANDERYEIIYHGDGPELNLYKQYCQENNIKNITFTGKYDNENKNTLLSDASVLNNCYGYIRNEGNKLKYAVSNRFYDGIIYHIPQLVESNGFKTEWIKKCRLGIPYTNSASFADDLWNYYMDIDAEEFDENCRTELENVLKEDDLYIKCIDDFIS